MLSNIRKCIQGSGPLGCLEIRWSNVEVCNPSGPETVSILLMCLPAENSSSQFAFSEVKPGTSAASCCVRLYNQHLCLCNVNASWQLFCCQTLISCDRWHIVIKNAMFTQYFVKKKKTTMGKYDVLLCLYISFHLSVCNASEGETSHSILKHTYPHRSSGAAWCWEAEFSYHLSEFLFTAFFCHENGQYWPGCQWGGVISVIGDTQNLTGHDPEQPALVGPALSSRSSFQLRLVNDSTVSWVYGWRVEWSHQNNFRYAVSCHLKLDHWTSVHWSLFHISG